MTASKKNILLLYKLLNNNNMGQFSNAVQGYTADELDNDMGRVCPSCLSDHLSEDAIKQDGLCVECTECTEYFHRDVEQKDNFERTHGYGML